MAREVVGTGGQAELERWLAPFLARLGHKARQRMCPLYVAGLIGPGERKSIQPMAERLGLGAHDRLHHFVSVGNWDAAPLLEELARKADGLLGGDDDRRPAGARDREPACEVVHGKHRRFRRRPAARGRIRPDVDRSPALLHRKPVSGDPEICGRTRH